MRCQVHSRPQTTKAMTTTATAMLAAICKLRRSSYQPLCLKMPRKKSPNPRSKPSPRAVLIKESRKNAPDNPAQTSASEPGKPWYWARRQATAVHRPNRQGTVSVATRKTSSVIAAVFGRSKIARDFDPTPARWRPGRHSRRASGRRARAMGSGGVVLPWRHYPLNRAAVKGLRFQPENASTGRYFNAELLQVPHRISCPAPGRNCTTTKPLDNPSTRRRGSPCPSEASSETLPDPVRPQCGQRSATVQALNAFRNA